MTDPIPCDCPLTPSGTRPPRPPYHRWNCSLTPTWAQTMRDLDVNPWTVIRPRDLALDPATTSTITATEETNDHRRAARRVDRTTAARITPGRPDTRGPAVAGDAMTCQDIIDTIAAHRGRERGMVCDEGELWCDGCGCIIRDDEWPHHTLAALRERYAIVELPEPVGNMVGPFRFSRGAGCECCPPEVYDTDTEVSYSVSEARVEAAALLAASAAAEADQ